MAPYGGGGGGGGEILSLGAKTHPGGGIHPPPHRRNKVKSKIVNHIYKASSEVCLVLP